MDPLAVKALAACIDHTLLKPEATGAEIDRLCEQAIEHQFYAVCVQGCRVLRAYTRLEASTVKVAAVVGFPLGAMDADVVRYETEAAVDAGAAEIDMVLNVGRFLDGDLPGLLRDIRDVVEAADERPVKLILETCLLTRDQIIAACHLASEAEVKFVKTSTGFGKAGATVDDVRLMRETVGPKMGVKASGGIRDFDTAYAMIRAGATRLGCSASVAILEGMHPV